MKTTLAIAAAFLVAGSNMALAADEPGMGKCCAMPKPQPPPPPTCACCAKMKAEAAAVAPSLDQLLATAKDAKGDDLLAAVLNKLIEERKGAPPSATPDAAPQGHQH